MTRTGRQLGTDDSHRSAAGSGDSHRSAAGSDLSSGENTEVRAPVAALYLGVDPGEGRPVRRAVDSIWWLLLLQAETSKK